MRLTPAGRRVLGAAAAVLLVSATFVTIEAGSALADSTTAAHAMRIAGQYQGTWTTPPTNLSSGQTQDGPMLGNGDVGVVEGGPINNHTFYVGKNDFFSSTTHAVKPLGRIVVSASGLSGSSYNVVQDIKNAEVRGTYTLNGQTLNTTSWTDANSNLFVTSFTLTGGGVQSIGITLQNGSGGTPSASNDGRVLSTDLQADTGGSGDPRARMAARTIGGSQSISGNKLTLSLSPGTTSTLVVAIRSSIDTSGYQSSAVSMVTDLTQLDVNNHNVAHRSWWQNFWSQSYVEIPDKAIEKSWYGSLYLLASASRTGRYAPGLWGNWITRDMNWNGDYHTNYNYEAPFYAALPTNHIDQIGAYDRPILDWQARAQSLASQNGFTGVLYPVGISPGGTSADMALHNQKSNAANLASDMVMRFEFTYDTGYANTVYPWLKQVGLFWQNYLTWDAANNRYVITNDAPHEDQGYPQTNSSMSLGLVHLLFQGLVDMSTALNVDSGTRSTWQNILSHLSRPATMNRNGQTIVRETEVGSDFIDDGNDIAAQFIYPSDLVGLDSSAADLQNARNTIGQLGNAWHGGNAPTTFYAAAARVGYSPATILSNLRNEATGQSYNNMSIHHNGGGLENVNVTTSGLSEMLLQSFQNDLKVFADWPSGTNAKFGDLMAYGGFLVSSDLENNTVQYLRVISQKGRSLTFTNPWPGQSLALYRNGSSAGTVSGSRITITTAANETVHLAPAGTAYSEILRRMSLTLGGGGAASGSVSLRAHANGNIVSADNAGAAPLIANRTAIGGWEQFDLITNPDGSVSLRAHANANFVSADNAGAAPLIANRTAIGGWEQFDLITNPDGSVSLRAHANANFVTADNAGAAPLIANRTAIGPWEEFDLIQN
jgi:alpha-L-fucosidase 2